jgi:hypothetical protein
VVLYNDADDDGFMECMGRDVIFENLTMLQVGGYDGIVKVGVVVYNVVWGMVQARCTQIKIV